MPIFPRISRPFTSVSSTLNTHMHSPFYQDHLEQMGMYLDEEALIAQLLGPQPIVPPRIFTLYELKHYYNGENGRPCYVSANGIVFDVTNCPAWNSGHHFSLTPGQDYSTHFTKYHCNDILGMSQKVPILGHIIYT